MKLGIAVVYLVDPEDEALLDLHLAQIDRHTASPFVIYGAATRASPASRERLERHPGVRLIDVPPSERRGGCEHAEHLERLIRTAFEDGATHVCTLHLDSFPVRAGWDLALAQRLDAGHALAGLMRDPAYDRKPMTACLFFARAFHVEHGPRLLLSEGERASLEYRRYATEWPHVVDSGVGYGFKAFVEGLSWCPLPRTDPGPPGWGFGVFGDVVFHLGGVTWYRKRDRGRGGWLLPLSRLASALVPSRLWTALAHAAPQRLRSDVGGVRLRQRKQELLADPEGFLERLGVRQVG